MQNNKNTGSYYTPSILSEFLVKHIKNNYNLQNIRILEPSCGDGSFINALLKNIPSNDDNISIDLCDINESELDKCCEILKSSNIFKTTKFQGDYLIQKLKTYSLIIGNPPYIAKKFLSKEQIAKCKEILHQSIEVTGEVKNIWPAFLIKSTTELEESGVLCFVLPSELLQVKHTKAIRDYLLKNYSRIEIFAFEELIFQGAEQDVVVFLGRKQTGTINCDVSFYQVEKLEDLKIPDYIEKHTNLNRKKLEKWTNYILTEDELNFVEGLIERLKLNKINYYCEKAEVGIVTAANDYFIRSKKDILDLNLQTVGKTIIKKSSYLKNAIIIDDDELNKIDLENKPSQILLFENKVVKKQTKSIQNYILGGEKQGLNERYKMKLRENWYVVPVTWPSEGLFVKRCHIHPKLLYNPSNALVTDSFYRVVTKSDYSIKNLTFSFYNTLTFVISELEGRFYGGGVLELTPSEFKNLYVPYIENSEDKLVKLNFLFKNKSDISDILDYTDSIILKGLSKKEIKKLRFIWYKLTKRRLKAKI